MGKPGYSKYAGRKLAAVAMGREKADLLIKDVRLINVNTGEILDHIDIAVSEGRIAFVGEGSYIYADKENIVEGKGYYACPGFIDGHLHIESSMMTVKEYARTVLPRGTTAIFPDPHEIANVCGIDGIKFMAEDAQNIPLKVFTLMPSCVPAVPGFETTGAVIDAEETLEMLQNDEIYGLGEMMNFPGVMDSDEETHKKIEYTLNENKIVTGHYSMPETGKGLNAYIASGVRCCHESVRKEDALAKMRLGMYAQLREGSAWRDLAEVSKSVTQQKIDTRFANLISDDTHPHTLIEQGHMDHIVRRAIEEGIDPISAIQMATINTAQCYSMDKDIGSIAPGKIADILLLSELETVKVEKVFAGGQLTAEGGKLVIPIEKSNVPAEIKNTMKTAKAFQTEDFAIISQGNREYRAVHVIQAVEAKTSTIRETALLKCENNRVISDVEKDIIKMAVINRHEAQGAMGKGFVKGFGFKQGAVASTVAHDAHNLMVAGTNDCDMALAANTLVKSGGGMVAVKEGKVLALLELPVAGLMSEESAETIAKKVDKLNEAWIELECNMVSPFMTMALLSLAVLPELRLTDKGLIDTVNFKFIDLFAD